MPRQTRPAITVDQIDAWLPQTQCTQCGYPRCRAYATAIARGEANINQCPPGNSVTIEGLARLLHTASKSLNPRFGLHQPRTRAVIDESLCIGCRKCLDVCPVDAILGARKLMHTVIVQECSGCALCLPPCPVNCIMLIPAGVAPVAEPWPEYTRAEIDHWQARTRQRLERLRWRQHMRPVKTPGRALPSSAEAIPPLPDDQDRIRAEIRAAVERVKRKRQPYDRNAR